jgi:phage terminase small subunit
MERITKKQEIFAKEYLATGHGTKSALKAYDTTDENTAAVIASENLRKHKVRAYLESKAEKASERIFELMGQQENLAVALNASKDILDRSGFKPVDKQEVTLEDKTQMSYDKAKSIIGGEGSNKSDIAK